MPIRNTPIIAALSLSLAFVACDDGGLEPEDHDDTVLRDHSWGTYHWARTTPSFTLTVLGSVTPEWETHVKAAVGDWTTSGVVDLTWSPSGVDTKLRRSCSAPDGAIRVCNLAYGFTGWLGIAGISLDGKGHIVRGYTKLNDSYFDTAKYDKTEWRRSVACQELGHNLGLDHQDEDFDNESLFSCMDYQDPPFESPNSHDWEQLAAIYAHLDSYDSYSAETEPEVTCKGKGCKGAEAGWGKVVHKTPVREVWARERPDGGKDLTFVRLAE